MNQQQATELGLNLLKDSPLFRETKSIIESSLPYVIQKYYKAGYEVVPAKMPVFKPGEIETFQKDGVIY